MFRRGGAGYENAGMLGGSDARPTRAKWSQRRQLSWKCVIQCGSTAVERLQNALTVMLASHVQNNAPRAGYTCAGQCACPASTLDAQSSEEIQDFCGHENEIIIVVVPVELAAIHEHQGHTHQTLHYMVPAVHTVADKLLCRVSCSLTDAT